MNVKAAIFAGQGAQFPGMGKDLAAADRDIAALYERANRALGFDLRKICFEGPAEELTKSSLCQPAIFVTSIACRLAFRKRYPQYVFDLAAGLSLGEWSALHEAGVLDFDNAIRVLEARGRFMQEACEEKPGGMVSVMNLARDRVASICEQSGARMANINSDKQIVLSGTREAVESAGKLAQEAGGKSIMLKVAGAFHSPLMNSARQKLATFMEDIPFGVPTMPVYANLTGKPHPNDGETIKQTMLRQVTEPVLWVDSIRAAAPRECIEFGPGKVLSGLIRRIDPTMAVGNVQDNASLEAVSALVENHKNG